MLILWGQFSNKNKNKGITGVTMSEDIRGDSLETNKPKLGGFKKRTERLKTNENLDHRLSALWNMDHDAISERFERRDTDTKVEDLFDFLKDSQTAREILNLKNGGKRAKVVFDDQTVISQFYPDTKMIVLNPDRPLAELACVLMKEMRRAWQADQGCLYNPIDFAPDEAILLNRAQQADALMIAVRVAWELKLQNQNVMWNFMIGAPFADVTRTFEIHAQNDFRSLNDGRAGRAAYDKWFEDQRTRIYDKRMIHQMLLDDTSYADPREARMQYLTDHMLLQIGHTPYGSNYMSVKGQKSPMHEEYSEVLDRSNANFLWFVKFERNFQQKENEMLEQSLDMSAEVIDFAKKAEELRTRS